MVEVLCINSKDKPDEIPLSRWIQKDFKYNITHIYFHPNQGIQGVDLAEVKLTPECYPYVTYKLSRFGVTLENLEKLRQLAKDCTELNEIDINKLLEESELEVLND